MSEFHVFALYVPQISTVITQLSLGTQQKIVDDHIAHRIQHVLRLTRGTQFIIFDRLVNIDCIFESGNKKIVNFTVKSINQNNFLQPSITCMLPMLKRDSLELAIYSLTELGASRIFLVQTEKSHNRWDDKKDRERLERIMQAAAEQSKNFAFPELVSPCSLDDLVKIFSSEISTKIFFDCEGKPFETALSSPCTLQKPLVVTFGPEGDLTGAEKELLKNNGFIFCALTPTILRAHQAVTVGIGILRTLFTVG